MGKSRMPARSPALRRRGPALARRFLRGALAPPRSGIAKPSTPAPDDLAPSRHGEQSGAGPDPGDRPQGASGGRHSRAGRRAGGTLSRQPSAEARRGRTVRGQSVLRRGAGTRVPRAGRHGPRTRRLRPARGDRAPRAGDHQRADRLPRGPAARVRPRAARRRRGAWQGVPARPPSRPGTARAL